jgi:hypothetical protein
MNFKQNTNLRDLCRVISKFKKGYQPRNNLVKDQKIDLLADSHRISNRWKYHFCQLLNVHGVNTVW